MKDYRKYLVLGFFGTGCLLYLLINMNFKIKHGREALVELKNDNNKDKQEPLSKNEAELNTRLGSIERNVINLVNRIGSIEKDLNKLTTSKNSEKSQIDSKIKPLKAASDPRPLPSMNHELVSKFPEISNLKFSESSTNASKIKDGLMDTILKSYSNDSLVKINKFDSYDDFVKYGDNLAKNIKNSGNKASSTRIIKFSDMIKEGQKIKNDIEDHLMPNIFNNSVSGQDYSKIKNIKENNHNDSNSITLEHLNSYKNDKIKSIQTIDNINQIEPHTKIATANDSKSEIFNLSENNKLQKSKDIPKSVVNKESFNGIATSKSSLNTLSDNILVKKLDSKESTDALKVFKLPFCESLINPEDSYKRKKCIFKDFTKYSDHKFNDMSHLKITKTLKGIVSDNIRLNLENMENGANEPNKIIKKTTAHIEDLKNEINHLKDKISKLEQDKNDSLIAKNIIKHNDSLRKTEKGDIDHLIKNLSGSKTNSETDQIIQDLFEKTELRSSKNSEGRKKYEDLNKENIQMSFNDTESSTSHFDIPLDLNIEEKTPVIQKLLVPGLTDLKSPLVETNNKVSLNHPVANDTKL